MVEETQVADQQAASASSGNGSAGRSTDYIVEVQNLKQYFPITAGLLLPARSGT